MKSIKTSILTNNQSNSLDLGSESYESISLEKSEKDLALTGKQSKSTLDFFTAQNIIITKLQCFMNPTKYNFSFLRQLEDEWMQIGVEMVPRRQYIPFLLTIELVSFQTKKLEILKNSLNMCHLVKEANLLLANADFGLDAFHQIIIFQKVAFFLIEKLEDNQNGGFVDEIFLNPWDFYLDLLKFVAHSLHIFYTYEQNGKSNDFPQEYFYSLLKVVSLALDNFGYNFKINLAQCVNTQYLEYILETIIHVEA